MIKTNLQRIVVMSFIASILLVPAGQVTKTFADEPIADTDSVNDINLRTIFHFGDETETINTFKLFDTLSSGFDRTKPLAFRLDGVIGWDRPLLYKAIDTTYIQGRNIGQDESKFKVEVIFQHGEQPFRQFTYSDCQVKNYNVYTEYDKEETFNGKTDFVYLDRIEFDCRGLDLGNPTYLKMLQDQRAEKIAEAMKNVKHTKNGKK
jgi:hypothetical protein